MNLTTDIWMPSRRLQCWWMEEMAQQWQQNIFLRLENWRQNWSKNVINWQKFRRISKVFSSFGISIQSLACILKFKSYLKIYFSSMTAEVTLNKSLQEELKVSKMEMEKVSNFSVKWFICSMNVWCINSTEAYCPCTVYVDLIDALYKMMGTAYCASCDVTFCCHI